MKLASVLVADPPWKFRDKLPGPMRGAVKHYGCLTARELMRFPLPVLADDAILYLWRVAAMQQEALDVMRLWGFTLKSEIVWVKTPMHELDGKVHRLSLAFGMGRYVRHCHETCLIGVRGKAKVRDRSTRSIFFAPLGRHSEKPDEFYRLVERLSAGPYVELFARKRRKGWTTMGNEL